MTRDEIYRGSDGIDTEADLLQAHADVARAKAKAIRWLGAPAWANCIVRPSKRGLDEMHYRELMCREHPEHATPAPAGNPQCEDDWRWAMRDNMGWLYFDENGHVSSPVEAGSWTIEERRP